MSVRDNQKFLLEIGLIKILMWNNDDKIDLRNYRNFVDVICKIYKRSLNEGLQWDENFNYKTDRDFYFMVVMNYLNDRYLINDFENQKKTDEVKDMIDFGFLLWSIKKIANGQNVSDDMLELITDLIFTSIEHSFYEDELDLSDIFNDLYESNPEQFEAYNYKYDDDDEYEEVFDSDICFNWIEDLKYNRNKRYELIKFIFNSNRCEDFDLKNWCLNLINKNTFKNCKTINDIKKLKEFKTFNTSNFDISYRENLDIEFLPSLTDIIIDKITNNTFMEDLFFLYGLKIDELNGLKDMIKYPEWKYRD